MLWQRSTCNQQHQFRQSTSYWKRLTAVSQFKKLQKSFTQKLCICMFTVIIMKYLYQELKMLTLLLFTMGGTAQFQFATCFGKMISFHFHICSKMHRIFKGKYQWTLCKFNLLPSDLLALLSRKKGINKYDITTDW